MPLAVMTDQLGPPENYSLREHDPGAPGAGEVRMRIRAAGISYVDVLTAAGNYQVKPPVPFIPGSECAGVVEAVGDGVTGFAPDDEVVASGWGGLFAEVAVLPAKMLQPKPAGLDFAEAAVFPVSYATAWHALVDRGQLKAGETLLVLGAGGATGFAAVQVGKHLGARVIVLASSDEKRALALAGGAGAAIDGRAEDWRDQVKAANGGKGVDVVFDPVGGAMTEAAFRSLGWNGRHLIIGFPAGMTALRTNLALIKGASLIGVDIRQFGIFEATKADANRKTIFALAGSDGLRPAIAHRYLLAEWKAAMEAAASGESAGRIVLIME
ncbi:NADPH:quinone oxidoreductase family protein [Sphingomonas lacunae]|uniref:NADPH:quinone oxidoreductase family protein n=2 Tax=Sphingomonas lacunae TaxID=2698828 RepID=A0A6M4AYR6_9SPHN|nr:NADPH:quinone oxidoreductase family protein [Sphingomonas lacunae]